jgi:hypothetical protein
VKRLACIFCIITLASIVQAHADKLTTSAAPCTQFESLALDANGDLAIKCKASAPAPTPTPTPTPPPPGACPPTPVNVTIGTLATSGLAKWIVDRARSDGLVNIYSYPLPRNATGQVQSSSSPDTPPSMTVQMSISKCPGDFDSAKDPSETFRWPWGGNPSYPCATLGSAESSVIRWEAVLSSGNCMVPIAEQWYVNIRLTDSLGNYSCPPLSATGPGCPFIFSWN